MSKMQDQLYNDTAEIVADWLETEGVDELRILLFRNTGEEPEKNILSSLSEFTYLWKLSDENVRHDFLDILDRVLFPVDNVYMFLEFIRKFDKDAVDKCIDHIINLDDHKKALRQFCEYCFYDPIEYMRALIDSNYENAFNLFYVIGHQ